MPSTSELLFRSKQIVSLPFWKSVLIWIIKNKVKNHDNKYINCGLLQNGLSKKIFIQFKPVFFSEIFYSLEEKTKQKTNIKMNQILNNLNEEIINLDSYEKLESFLQYFADNNVTIGEMKVNVENKFFVANVDEKDNNMKYKIIYTNPNDNKSLCEYLEYSFSFFIAPPLDEDYSEGGINFGFSSFKLFPKQTVTVSSMDNNIKELYLPILNSPGEDHTESQIEKSRYSGLVLSRYLFISDADTKEKLFNYMVEFLDSPSTLWVFPENSDFSSEDVISLLFNFEKLGEDTNLFVKKLISKKINNFAIASLQSFAFAPLSGSSLVKKPTKPLHTTITITNNGEGVLLFNSVPVTIEFMFEYNENFELVKYFVLVNGKTNKGTEIKIIAPDFQTADVQKLLTKTLSGKQIKGIEQDKKQKIISDFSRILSSTTLFVARNY